MDLNSSSVFLFMKEKPQNAANDLHVMSLKAESGADSVSSTSGVRLISGVDRVVS